MLKPICGNDYCFHYLQREFKKPSKLWAGRNATGRESCARLTDWRRERHRQLAHWAVICWCVCACVRSLARFSAAPNEISHQAKSFSSSLQKRLKVRLTDSADAFYSPLPALGCQMRGYRCPPTPLFIPTLIHPLHTLPSLHYYSGPPWQESVHLPVKLVGGRRMPGYPCWRAAGRWIGWGVLISHATTVIVL